MKPRLRDPLAEGLALQLREYESDPALREPANLPLRSAARNELETSLFFEAPSSLHDRSSLLFEEFDALDATYCAALREAIKAGNGADVLRSCIEDPNDEPVDDDVDRYDYRDDLVTGILRLDPPADPRIGQHPDSVFYQPTPARHLFALLRKVPLDANDVLVDLGSGLGHVALVAAICTPARCVGIEIEPAYVEVARRCAAALQLTGAEFRCEDARIADFSTGTVFYLYTPFGGAMLREVLDRLQREASTRPIRVASFGPVTTTLANEAWLAPDGKPSTSRLALFRSR